MNCISSSTIGKAKTAQQRLQAGSGSAAPAEAEFIDHFGSFNGKRERQRWETLVEAIGFARAQEIAAWAERKEIHMINRGGLMDSLETAAKKQTNGLIYQDGPVSSKETGPSNVFYELLILPNYSMGQHRTVFFYPILYHCGGVAGPNFEMPT